MENCLDQIIFKKRVSVIVTAFNEEKLISRCIRSLLNQTLSKDLFEIIIVNDGSNDNTSYVINLFKDPKKSLIKIIENETNLGLPASLNKAINHSTAPFIIRVDGDDFVNQNFLYFLKYYLETNLEAGAVACDYLLVDKSEKVIKRVNCFEEPIGCGILFKKENLFDIGLYDEKFLCNEEKEMRIRFEKKYKIERLAIPLYRYRRHENNLTNNKKIIQKYDLELKKKYSSEKI